MRRWAVIGAVASLNLLAGLAFSASFELEDLWIPVLVSTLTATLTVSVTTARGVALLPSVVTVMAGLLVSLLGVGWWANVQSSQGTADVLVMVREGLVDGWWSILTTTVPTPVHADLLAPVVLTVYVATALSSALGCTPRTRIGALAPPVLLVSVGWMFGAGGPADRPAATAAAIVLAGTVLVLTAGVDEAHAGEEVSQPGAIDPRVLRARSEIARSRMIAGSCALALIAIASLVITPLLPLADATDPFTLRDYVTPEKEDHQVINPLASVRYMHEFRGEDTLFTSETEDDDPVRLWRLAVLDTYDGTTWRSSGSFENAGTALPDSYPPEVASREYREELRIDDLDSPWIPLPGWPLEIDPDDPPLDLRYAPAEGMVAVGSGTSDQLVVSSKVRIPQPSAGEIITAVPASGAESEPYLQLPGSIPGPWKESAEQIVDGRYTTFDRAATLRDFFREGERFVLDAEAPSGHNITRIDAFLADGHGDDEQFATAYAVMARSLGIPTRVVVGFRGGAEAAGDPERVAVRGGDAHAWPEVWLAGIGWIAFDPAPGLDDEIPAAGDLALSEELERAEERVEAQHEDEADPTGAPAVAVTRPDGQAGRSMPGWLLPLMGAFLLVVGLPVAIAYLKGRRRRIRKSQGSPHDRVAGAWDDSLDRLVETGLGPLRAMSASEIGSATRTQFGEQAAGHLLPLGHLANRAFFDDASLSESHARRAWAAADELRSELQLQLPRRKRLLALLDPRPLLTHRHASSPSSESRVAGSPLSSVNSQPT